VTDIGLLFLGALVVACPVVMGVQAVRVGRGMIRVPLLVVRFPRFRGGISYKG